MNISKQNGALVVPDQPTIPFIEGDGLSSKEMALAKR